MPRSDLPRSHCVLHSPVIQLLCTSSSHSANGALTAPHPLRSWLFWNLLFKSQTLNGRRSRKSHFIAMHKKLCVMSFICITYFHLFVIVLFFWLWSLNYDFPSLIKLVMRKNKTEQTRIFWKQRMEDTICYTDTQKAKRWKHWQNNLKKKMDQGDKIQCPKYKI